MTAKPRRPLLVNLTWAVAALMGLLVLYSLSLGPASVLMTHCLRADYCSEEAEDALIRGYNALYSPMGWLLERAPWWIADPYYAYLEMWDS